MKDTEVDKLLDFASDGHCLSPVNENAHNLIHNMAYGEIAHMKEIGARDLKYHKAYMSFLNYIYDYMPDRFKEKVVDKKNFYKWLKHLRKYYDKGYAFLDADKVADIKEDLLAIGVGEKTADKISLKHGRVEMIEYRSISFSRMSEKQFREYVKGQLPYLYENVLGAFYEGEILDGIISTIEEDYKKFLSKI